MKGRMHSAGVDMEMRRRVYRRDGYRCAMCDSTKYLQLHHCVPRGKGGADREENLICLCSDCHALCHGLDTRGVEITPEEMRHSVVEYLADFYAEQGILWNPWKKGVM